jgi:hypothetical protein
MSADLSQLTRLSPVACRGPALRMQKGANETGQNQLRHRSKDNRRHQRERCENGQSLPIEGQFI